MRLVLSTAVFIALSLLTLCAAWADDKPRKGAPEDAPKLDFAPYYYQGNRVTIDGNLNDWAGIEEVEITQLVQGEYEYDWTGPKDLSAKAKMQVNDNSLFFYLKVRDNIITIPTRKQGGDKVELWFDTGKLNKKKERTRMLLIDPSYVLENQIPSVDWQAPKSKKGEATDVTIQGYQLEDGYDLEIEIPLASLSDQILNYEDMGFCVVIRDWDQDDENEDEAAIASCPLHFKKKRKQSYDQYGKITWDTRDRIYKGLESNYPDAKIDPTEALRANLAGDANLEEVLVVEGNLIVLGVGIGHADWFGYSLGLAPNDSVAELKLQDLTGDGYEDIIVTTHHVYNINGQDLFQDILWVYQFIDGNISDPLVGIEVGNGIEAGELKVENEVSFGKKKITINAPKKANWSKEDYVDIDNGFHDDYLPLLLPWEKPRKRTLKYPFASE